MKNIKVRPIDLLKYQELWGIFLLYCNWITLSSKLDKTPLHFKNMFLIVKN